MRKKLAAAGIVFLLYLLLGTSLPYLWHKEVSQEYLEELDVDAFFRDNEGEEHVAYVKDNSEAMIWRLRMLQAAKEEIILSTFDFNADDAGRDIMAALIQAADRGVSVQIMVDGFSGFWDMKGNKWFQALAAHEKIEMKVYNPLNLIKPWKLQTRLHDKYLIVDNQYYLLGGRNIMNLFLGDYSHSKNTDGDLFVYREQSGGDTSVGQLKAYFEQIWNLEESKDYVYTRNSERVKDAGEKLRERTEHIRSAYPQAYEEADWLAGTIPVKNILLLHNPIEAVNKEPWLWNSLLAFMQTGREIIIHTPYIICSGDMYEDVTNLCKGAESVSILTNAAAGGANPFGCTDYLNQEENILDTGVTVYEYLGEHSKHEKMVLIDDNISIIGSFNFDMRSVYLDTELMLVVDSKELNAMLREDTLEEMKYSKRMAKGEEYEEGEYYVERSMGFPKRMAYGLLRILLPAIRHLL